MRESKEVLFDEPSLQNGNHNFHSISPFKQNGFLRSSNTRNHALDSYTVRQGNTVNIHDDDEGNSSSSSLL